MIRPTFVLWLALASGCGASLEVPEQATLTRRDWVVVPFPPPPARPELIPPQPDVASVWIDGEWRWRTARWSWIYVRWVQPPEEAAGFARWQLSREKDGSLRYAPGVWVSTAGRRLPPQTEQGVADAREGDVVEDVGIMEEVGRNRHAKPSRDDSPDSAACDLGCRFDDDDGG